MVGEGEFTYTSEAGGTIDTPYHAITPSPVGSSSYSDHPHTIRTIHKQANSIAADTARTIYWEARRRAIKENQSTVNPRWFDLQSYGGSVEK